MKKSSQLLTLFVCLLLIATASLSYAASGGIGFRSKTTMTVLEQVVGDEVTFTISARDKGGNLIRGWSNTGSDVTLVVANSGANTDSEPLTVTEIRDKNRALLPQTGGNTFTLAKALFVDGETQIFFRTTKADTGITITATPSVPQVQNVSATMNYRADVVSNFLVRLVPAKQPNIVYVMRRYEVQVIPRDRYNNINSTETVFTKFTARYPGEFDNTGGGTADIFSGEHILQGALFSYFITSTQVRTDQSITCYKSSDNNVRGTTGNYVVAAHAPDGFSLIQPLDNTEIFIDYAAQIEDMKWQAAADPYTNIDVGGQKFSDQVTYRWAAYSLSGAPLMELGSNNVERDPKLTLTGSQLVDIIDRTTGLPSSKSTVILWSVKATDGLFTTRSTEEWKLTITKRNITDVPAALAVHHFELAQNYPNPFNPSTSISFTIAQKQFVSLKVFDLLGNEITTLVGKTLDAGSHQIVFNAKHLPSGMYLYKLQAGSNTATRKMALMK